MVLNALRAGRYPATVSSVRPLAPHFQRVVFAAPELLTAVPHEPTGWLRFWFPLDDQVYQRAYTVAEVDLAAGTFATDFLLHQPEGAATRWLRQAQPGETIEVSVYGSTNFSFVEPEPDGYLLVGDAASLPAVNTVLAAAPGDVRIEVLLDLAREEDRQIPILRTPGATVSWLPRESAQLRGFDAALEDLVEGGTGLQDWRVWIATESAETRRLKRLFRERYEVPRAQLTAQGYWIEGKPMGTRYRAD
jgi:ATP-binding cassette subfamily B protein IrtA